MPPGRPERAPGVLYPINPGLRARMDCRGPARLHRGRSGRPGRMRPGGRWLWWLLLPGGCCPAAAAPSGRPAGAAGDDAPGPQPWPPPRPGRPPTDMARGKSNVRVGAGPATPPPSPGGPGPALRRSAGRPRSRAFVHMGWRRGQPLPVSVRGPAPPGAVGGRVPPRPVWGARSTGRGSAAAGPGQAPYKRNQHGGWPGL